MVSYIFEFFGDVVIQGLGYLVLRYGFKKDIDFDSMTVTYTGLVAFVVLASLCIGLVYLLFLIIG